MGKWPTPWNKATYIKAGLRSQFAIPWNWNIPSEILRDSVNTLSAVNTSKLRGRGKEWWSETAAEKHHNPRTLLVNVRSLHSKLDQLQANIYHLQEYRNARMMPSQTWGLIVGFWLCLTSSRTATIVSVYQSLQYADRSLKFWSSSPTLMTKTIPRTHSKFYWLWLTRWTRYLQMRQIFYFYLAKPLSAKWGFTCISVHWLS